MASGDSYSPPVKLRCKGAEATHALVEGVQTFSLDAALEAGQAARLAILVEELVANLVEHGGIGAEGEIELVLAQDEGGLAIILSDPGNPFDPREAGPGDRIPERGGGVGIDLVKAWADIVDYRSDGGRNRLELRLRAG